MDYDKLIRFEDLDMKVPLGNLTINILFISFEPSTPGWGYESHSHSTWELHLIPKGYGMLQAMGKKYTIAPGTLYLTGPGIIHEQQADLEDPMCEYCINFEMKISKRSNKKSDVHAGAEIENIISTLTNTHFWIGNDLYESRFYFDRTFNELMDPRTGYYTLVQNFLSIIILNLTRCMSNRDEKSFYFPKKIVNDSRIFIIDESFSKNYKTLTPEYLCTKICTSVRQLNRIMKSHYHLTFTEKLTLERLAHACKLLAETDFMIKDISEMVGFSNPNYFSRVFEVKIGTPPTEYRNRVSLRRPDPDF